MALVSEEAVSVNVFASAAVYNYILDAHNDLRMEISVALVMMRNFFWFGLSHYLPIWTEGPGVAKVFRYSRWH